MKQSAFAHLHSHTEYSLLDGSNRIRDYLDRVKELGMESAAITDHGVMYGEGDSKPGTKICVALCPRGLKRGSITAPESILSCYAHTMRG